VSARRPPAAPGISAAENGAADERDRVAEDCRALFAPEGVAREGDPQRALRMASAVLDHLPLPATGGEAGVGDPLRRETLDAFEPEAAPQPGDARLAERLAAKAMAGVPVARRTLKRRWLGLPPSIVVVALTSSVLAATTATVAIVRNSGSPVDLLDPSGPPASPARKRGPRPAGRADAPARAAEAPARGAEPRALDEAAEPAVAPAPTLEAPAALPPAETRPRAARPAPAALPAAKRAPHRDEDDGATATELFRRGNELRRAGERAAAAAVYRRLALRHPASDEAALSRLSLADLLEQEGRHEAALEQLDAYLDGRKSGNLVEEALRRKARTLDRLGQSARAAATWRELLRRFPNSVYAAEINARLRSAAHPPP
jgi:TolA-binding protein